MQFPRKGHLLCFDDSCHRCRPATLGGHSCAESQHAASACISALTPRCYLSWDGHRPGLPSGCLVRAGLKPGLPAQSPHSFSSAIGLSFEQHTAESWCGAPALAGPAKHPVIPSTAHPRWPQVLPVGSQPDHVRAGPLTSCVTRAPSGPSWLLTLRGRGQNARLPLWLLC